MSVDLASANFEGAWAYATGKGVLVGIIDEGVNYTHLDLAGSYATDLDYDPRDDASAPDAMPDDLAKQHGTEVAGIIAGSIDNTIGTIGAAPDATITASYIRYGSRRRHDRAGRRPVAAVRLRRRQQQLGIHLGIRRQFPRRLISRDCGRSSRMPRPTGAAASARRSSMAAGNGKLNIGGENLGDDANFHNLSNSRYVIAVGAHNVAGRRGLLLESRHQRPDLGARSSDW